MLKRALPGWALLLALGALPALHAEVRQCSEHRVDYLIGGIGKGGSGGRTCGAGTAGTSTPAVESARGATAVVSAGTGATAGPGARTMIPDDEGRREILQQELDKARASMAELENNPVPVPGAGTLAEQRARRISDITSLQAELGRLKR